MDLLSLAEAGTKRNTKDNNTNIKKKRNTFIFYSYTWVKSIAKRIVKYSLNENCDVKGCICVCACVYVCVCVCVCE